MSKTTFENLHIDDTDTVRGEPHSIYKERLKNDYKDFLAEPTHENLTALVEQAINYQNSVLLGKGRRI